MSNQESFTLTPDDYTNLIGLIDSAQITGNWQQAEQTVSTLKTLRVKLVANRAAGPKAQAQGD